MQAFGFVFGGFDATSSTIRWAVKFLAQYQDEQACFRVALYKSIPVAVASGRDPTVNEIMQASDPYIDAMLEELISHSITLPGSVRKATRDTSILGHHIPKGTDVYLLMNGPGSMTPGYAIDETKRSKSSRIAIAEGRVHQPWDPSEIGSFKPERWLHADGNGKTVFDKMSGLHLTFGMGPRGCWGRKIAELEFRIFMSLFVWNFRFRPIEGELLDDTYVDKLTRLPNKCFIGIVPV